MTIKIEAGSSPEAISRGSQVFKALTRLSKGFGLALRLLAWNKQGRGAHHDKHYQLQRTDELDDVGVDGAEGRLLLSL